MRIPMNAGLGSLAVVLLAALTCAAPSLAQTTPSDETSKAARILAISVCVHCHGAAGLSADTDVPRIAGQQRTYLEVQIKNFLAQTRRDPEAQHYMWGISSAWLANAEIIAQIAVYFSSPPPAQNKPGDARVVALGKQLYEKANADARLPSCMGCHWANAEGLSVSPRLAGQHADYLTKEMKMQRVGLRGSPPMHGGVLGLADDEIVALATYMESK